jgi:GDSL-like Lipase/Acylhydrolase
MERYEEILDASLFPSAADLDGATRDVYRNLFLDLGPSLLESAIVSWPDHQQIDRVWTILDARRKWAEDPTTSSSSSSSSPPLRILVMGGSVTEGVGCVQSDSVQGRACNWSVRLESFLNRMLGYDAVRIINIAQGGTGTDQALAIVKYWIYPVELDGTMPDVIIHAFGSNDSHLGPGTGRSEEDRIHELFRQCVDRLNLFTQTVQRSHPCPTPIIVHLDDYFGGHKQGALLGDFTYRMVSVQASNGPAVLCVERPRCTRLGFPTNMIASRP